MYSLFQVEGEEDPVKLQMCANSIALIARSLSFDSEFMSPFSINARRNNINTMGTSSMDHKHNKLSNSLFFFVILGGKPDDITVVLASVVI